MDLKQLRSFKAVVDYQTFSKAAEKLNMGQSSVSTHLLQLEKELGVTLLNRTTKTIEVTEAGQTAYSYASRILELERCIREVCSPDGGRIIRIGASTIPAAYILPDVLAQYGHFSSNDRLKVTQCRSREVANGVQEGQFDVGLISYPVEREGIKCVPLCRNRMVLITPHTEPYLHMKRKGNTIRELLNEPIILREAGDGSRMTAFLESLGIDESMLRIVARVNDQEAVKHMVTGGMGISLISEIAARNYVQTRRVLQFDLPHHQECGQIYLIYPDRFTPKDAAWNFIDYLSCMHR